jgi:hypothetical protein
MLGVSAFRNDIDGASMLLHALDGAWVRLPPAGAARVEHGRSCVQGSLDAGDGLVVVIEQDGPDPGVQRGLVSSRSARGAGLSWGAALRLREI